MLAVAEQLEQMDWQGMEQPVISLHGVPDDEKHTDPIVGWRVGGHLGHVPRYGRGLWGGAVGHLHPRVAQFGSFRLPLVILTPVPLTFLGIMLGHWLFGAPFSATSMIGFIALAGIIVRNSILLVDFIRHEGKGRVDLDILIAAGATRFKTDPADSDCRDDRGRRDPDRPDFSRLGYFTAVRFGHIHDPDGAGDPSDLPRL